jgi:hypothetical protein
VAKTTKRRRRAGGTPRIRPRTRAGPNRWSRWRLPGPGVALVLSFAVCCAVWGLRAVFPAKPAAIPISAALRHTGSVAVVFGGDPTEATSPACGCFHHAPPGGWRGIVFPAASLTLSRTRPSAANPSAYGVFQPTTGEYSAIPGTFGIGTRVLIEDVPERIKLSSTVLLNPARYHARVLAAIPTIQDLIGIVTRHPLHIETRGRIPIAAIIPAYRANTTVHFATAGAGLSLTSAFSNEPKSALRGGGSISPAVDVLGGTKLLWTDVTSIPQPLWVTDFDIPIKLVTSRQQAVALARTATAQSIGERTGGLFSGANRLAAVPRGYRRVLMVAVPQDDAFAIRIEAAGDGGYAPLATGTVGGLTVATGALGPSDRRLLATADPNPTVTLTDLPRMIFGTARTPGARNTYTTQKSMEFEYPPDPPLDGVDVFGRVSVLSLQEAEGALTLGTKPEELSAPTPLTLKDIVGRGVVGDRFFVPIAAGKSRVHLTVQGTADTRINGIPVATAPSLIDRTLGNDKLMLFSAVAALFFAALATAEVTGRRGRGRR